MAFLSTFPLNDNTKGFRFEVTGGNGRGATVEQIRNALTQAGARHVSQRRAFGWSNQPYVATFAALGESDAKVICEKACAILWPDDSSILANLIAFEY